MIETSDSIVKLTTAIIQVQGGITGVKKDAVNPHFKNRYATLENVIDTARPALQEAKIAFVQAPGIVTDGSVEVTTMLVHESGEWMRSTLHVPLQKRDAQGVGSAITYGCRYSLMAMLGLPPTDDDGEAATQPEPQQKRQVGYRDDGTRTSFALKNEQPDLTKDAEREVDECATLVSLEKLRDAYRKKIADDKLNKSYQRALKEIFARREDEIRAEMERLEHAEPEELAQLDPRSAFEHSNPPVNNLRAG